MPAHGSYGGLLFDPRWRSKRAIILDRDFHCCVVCHSAINLQVHHRQYRKSCQQFIFKFFIHRVVYFFSRKNSNGAEMPNLLITQNSPDIAEDVFIEKEGTRQIIQPQKNESAANENGINILFQFSECKS